MSTTVVAETEVEDVQSPERHRGTAPEPSLRIGTLADDLPRRKGSPVVAISAILHMAVLALVVVVPLLTSDSLPEPAPQVRAFLVEPAAIAPPPPPPPPAPRSAAAARPEAEAPKPSEFVAPVETPTAVEAVDGLDLGIEGGVPGGVEGGVEGGVMGGVIGGLPEAPPPPVAPVRVGGVVKEPKKLKHVVPEYPELARQSRVQGVVIIEALVGPDGRVQRATVLRGVPILDQAALSAVKQWVYGPTLISGVPAPVIMTVTVTFNIATP